MGTRMPNSPGLDHYEHPVSSSPLATARFRRAVTKLDRAVAGKRMKITPDDCLAALELLHSRTIALAAEEHRCTVARVSTAGIATARCDSRWAVLRKVRERVCAYLGCCFSNVAMAVSTRPLSCTCSQALISMTRGRISSILSSGAWRAAMSSAGDDMNIASLDGQYLRHEAIAEEIGEMRFPEPGLADGLQRDQAGSSVLMGSLIPRGRSRLFFIG